MQFNDLFKGFSYLTWEQFVMYAIGFILIYLAIKKKYEPMLLLPIGFGAILVNLPLATVWEHDGNVGFLKFFYEVGIISEVFPIDWFFVILCGIRYLPTCQR